MVAQPPNRKHRAPNVCRVREAKDEAAAGEWLTRVFGHNRRRLRLMARKNLRASSEDEVEAPWLEEDGQDTRGFHWWTGTALVSRCASSVENAMECSVEMTESRECVELFHPRAK